MTKCNEDLLNIDIVKFIHGLYPGNKSIQLHEPQFTESEIKAVSNAIKSTFVSTIGDEIIDFEEAISKYTNAISVTATMNGTSALHAILTHLGVGSNDAIITQPFNFVAASNAISYNGGTSIFVDISKKTLGLCPKALENFLEQHTYFDDLGQCTEKKSKKVIKAVMPMHTFGHPVEIDEISNLCKKWNLILIEDAAESLGSFFKGIHTGTYGDYGAFSFNGNKIITTGGGGAIIAQDQSQDSSIKHLISTAKIKHSYEFIHDRVGFNYRMPNLNASLGNAQLEKMGVFLLKKRELALKYRDFFSNKSEYSLFWEPDNCSSNFWLNSIVVNNRVSRDRLIEYGLLNGISFRPAWKLISSLGIHKDIICYEELENAKFFEDRVVNLPSTPIL
jgi:aminotransferase in exopolysaccharide biosynthesis